jgi:hypothetical protein
MKHQGDKLNKGAPYAAKAKNGLRNVLSKRKRGLLPNIPSMMRSSRWGQGVGRERAVGKFYQTKT